MLQGTYYSTDDHESNAYHYHNTCVLPLPTQYTRRINLTGTHDDRSDGSVFYRYSDGSEYYRRKNGNITFRPPVDPSEKVEGADPAAALTPTADRTWRPWYDWPPRLNLYVNTSGTSVIIRETSGLTVTFEPMGSNAGADPVPVRSVFPSTGSEL